MTATPSTSIIQDPPCYRGWALLLKKVYMIYTLYIPKSAQPPEHGGYRMIARRITDKIVGCLVGCLVLNGPLR